MSKNLPTITTIGITRNDIGWQLVTIITQGDKVISKTLSEPDMRAITIDNFKVAAAKLFVEEPK